MNLFLHGASDFQIVRGDTLRNPVFFLGDSLATFDCVIANPPFSLENWGDEVWASDPFGRNFAGMPPGKSGDYVWVQHMIKSMAAGTGRMAVGLPHRALFRMGKEGEIRQKILGMDLLEAVIGLGPNLFYGTGLAACIRFKAESGTEGLRRGKFLRKGDKILQKKAGGIRSRPQPVQLSLKSQVRIYQLETSKLSLRSLRMTAALFN